MSKTRLVAIVSIVGIAAIVAISFPLATTKAETGHEHHGQMGKMDMKKDMTQHAAADALSLEKIRSEQMPMVVKSIEKAIEAVESGDKETALAELHKAQKMIVGINEAIGKHIKPKFVNSKCPIWEIPIEPDKVTKDLIRDYKGQKVAFCCADCPPKWDKLSDAQRDAKLAKAKPKTAKNHSDHKH